ncbi:TetR/AcrR family transcriptional regulator [Pontibacter arcticus]|uniref:TetR/AcrR family transcriptional regulator n=1 Tax=Pontibacter arcticus TaxID=2080288 RepID=A0A364RG48_9BACT|nr:TetR/AcrR family transcriptional regulator [Pontibacter arcticus]RAU83146.1 TetR/AcrR family transcriptional regulator [Pontibacter arcticus]
MENLAEKKKAILESTLALVKVNGFHGTPMSMVAKKAGVAAGTIYHYFESKDSLIFELYSYLKQQAIQVVRESQKPDATYQERFFALWFAFYTYYTSNPSVLCFFEQFVNSPYAEKAKSIPSELDELLHAFFEEGINSGQLRPVAPQILSMLAHGNAISLAKVYGIGKLNLATADLELVVQILWDGMSQKTSEINS